MLKVIDINWRTPKGGSHSETIEEEESWGMFPNL
jgi:hypothetical protein